MTARGLAVAGFLACASVLALAAADGSWLKKVSPADHARANPLAAQPEAAAAGKNLYRVNCAKCHGDAAQGKGSRPALVSPRVAAATDGDLAWIVKNGVPYKGMPGWGALPEQEHWQLVAYLRSANLESLNSGSLNPESSKQGSSKQGSLNLPVTPAAGATQ